MVWVLGAALAAVTTESPPLEGVETRIALTDERGEPASGETVRVVHRPGLSGEQELAIGITDGRGRVRWVPAAPGVARIRGGDEVLLVDVAPARLAVSTAVTLGHVAAAALACLAYGLAERRG